LHHFQLKEPALNAGINDFEILVIGPTEIKNCGGLSQNFVKSKKLDLPAGQCLVPKEKAAEVTKTSPTLI
jgi:hypothetical protein